MSFRSAPDNWKASQGVHLALQVRSLLLQKLAQVCCILCREIAELKALLKAQTSLDATLQKELQQGQEQQAIMSQVRAQLPL